MKRRTLSRPNPHELFMERALTLAREAADLGEVPIAALLVRGGEVLTEAHNLTRTLKDPTAHCEIVVLQAAAKLLKNERFTDCALYVTLEPCAMCAGAIVQARLPLVVYGAKDAKAGACGSVLRVLPNKKLNHRPTVVSGVRADEAREILQGFFRARRRSLK